MKHAFFLSLALPILLFVATSTAAATQIEVQALFKGRAMLMVDGKRRMLSEGQTSPEGVKLLAANARGARVEFNGEERTLSLGSRIGSNFKGPREQQVRIVADGQGMYAANGFINGVSVRFILDTGATLVSMNEALARKLGLDYRGRGTAGESITANGIVPIWRLNLIRVSIGGIELTDVEGAVHEGDFPPVPLLGNSFLSRLEMLRSGSSVVLKRTH